MACLPGGLLALLCVFAASGGVAGSAGKPSAGGGGGFLFDKARKHATISVLDSGRVASKEEGEDYQTVLLHPEAPRGERSLVEFSIEKQAAHQCFIAFGVSDGEHDYVGDGVDGRSALAAQGSWMLSTQSGKYYHDGGQSEQYLPGEGTVPFMPGDDAKKLGSVRPREGDKVLWRPLRLRGGCGVGGECLAELLIKGLCANEMSSSELWDVHALLKQKAKASQADAAAFVRVNVSIPASSEEPWVNIHIVGSWNDWLSVHPLSLALDTMKWEVELLVPKGKHLFKLLKGGEWCLTSAYPTESDAFPSPGNNVLEVEAADGGDADLEKKAQLLLRDNKAAESAMKAIARLAKVRKDEEEQDREEKIKQEGIETAQQRADTMLEEAKMELAAVVGSMIASDSIKITVQAADGKRSEELTVIPEDTIGYALTLAGAEDGDYVDLSGQRFVVNSSGDVLERTLRSCGVRDGDVLKLERDSMIITVVGVDVEGGETQLEVHKDDDISKIITGAGHDPSKAWLDWAGGAPEDSRAEGDDDEGVKLRPGQTVRDGGLKHGDVVEVCNPKPKRVVRGVAIRARKLAVSAVKRTLMVGLGGCAAGGCVSLGMKSGLNLTKIDKEMLSQVGREIKDVGTWGFAAGKAIGAQGLWMARELGMWGIVGFRELGKGGIVVGRQIAKGIPPTLHVLRGALAGGVAMGSEVVGKISNDTKKCLQPPEQLPEGAATNGKDKKAVPAKPAEKDSKDRKKDSKDRQKDSKDRQKVPPWQRGNKPAAKEIANNKQSGWMQRKDRKGADKDSPETAEKDAAGGKSKGWLRPRGSKPPEPSKPSEKPAGAGVKRAWLQPRGSKPAESDQGKGKQQGWFQQRGSKAEEKEKSESKPQRGWLKAKGSNAPGKHQVSAEEKKPGDGRRRFFLQRMGDSSSSDKADKAPGASDGRRRGFL